MLEFRCTSLAHMLKLSVVSPGAAEEAPIVESATMLLDCLTSAAGYKVVVAKVATFVLLIFPVEGGFAKRCFSIGQTSYVMIK